MRTPGSLATKVWGGVVKVGGDATPPSRPWRTHESFLFCRPDPRSHVECEATTQHATFDFGHGATHIGARQDASTSQRGYVLEHKVQWTPADRTELSPGPQGIVVCHLEDCVQRVHEGGTTTPAATNAWLCGPVVA